jgi:hypothetical protein
MPCNHPEAVRFVEPDNVSREINQVILLPAITCWSVGTVDRSTSPWRSKAVDLFDHVGVMPEKIIVIVV